MRVLRCDGREPTSAVDGRTRKLIRQTLGEFTCHVALAIISPRVETTAQCDLIMVRADRKRAAFGERDAVLTELAHRNMAWNQTEFDGRPYGALSSVAHVKAPAWREAMLRTAWTSIPSTHWSPLVQGVRRRITGNCSSDSVTAGVCAW